MSACNYHTCNLVKCEVCLIKQQWLFEGNKLQLIIVHLPNPTVTNYGTTNKMEIVIFKGPLMQLLNESVRV